MEYIEYKSFNEAVDVFFSSLEEQKLEMKAHQQVSLFTKHPWIWLLKSHHINRKPKLWKKSKQFVQTMSKGSEILKKLRKKTFERRSWSKKI